MIFRTSWYHFSFKIIYWRLFFIFGILSGTANFYQLPDERISISSLGKLCVACACPCCCRALCARYQLETTKRYHGNTWNKNMGKTNPTNIEHLYNEKIHTYLYALFMFMHWYSPVPAVAAQEAPFLSNLHTSR
jgi:hypothetical protein